MMNIIQAVEECKCQGPLPGERWFFCERHQCDKTLEWHQLCQTRQDYFKLWEAGIGPGQLQPPKSLPHGPGTELTKLFRPIRPFVRKGCKCEEHAAEMDRNGCDWCEANLDTIVGWLEQEAAASHLVFNRPMAEKLVKWAIRRARRKERKVAKAASVV